MGSKLLWLLRHEWKLSLRNSPNARWVWLAAVVIVVLSIVSAFWLRQVLSAVGVPNIGDLPTLALLGTDAVLLFFFLIMTSVAVQSSVQMLFERGDMDLLLSSPLDTRLVLTSRGLWLAVSTLLAVALFVVPLTVGGVVFAGLRVLGTIPLFIALALMASALGLTLTLTLVRWLGARRARTVAQVVGVLLGAAFYLLTQLARFINTDNLPWLSNAFSGLTTLEPNHPLFWPAKAVWFDPMATLLMLAVGGLVFWASVQLTHRAFLTGATASVLGGQVKPPSRTARFADQFWINVLRKEWRLIGRDPMLISQTLMQLLYFLPMLFAFFGSSGRRGSGFDLLTLGTYSLLTVAAIFVGGSLAQSITQIVVGAEDAPELIRMSPAPSDRVRIAKLMAAILPVWVLFVPLILWRSVLEPQHLLILIGFAAVTILGGLMILWTAKPFNRGDLKQRNRQQNWLVGLGFFVMSTAWVAVLLLPQWLPVWWSLIPLIIALAIPALTYVIAKETSSLGY